MAETIHLVHSAVIPTSEKTEEVLVVSDTHFSAPYASRKKAEAILTKELSNKRTRICVLLGDIYEGVNLPIKHLPKNEKEVGGKRIELVAKYATGKLVTLSKEALKDIPHLSRDELGEFLCDIDQEGYTRAAHYLPQMRGDTLKAFMYDPTEALGSILKQSQTQEEALIEAFDRHMEHLRWLVTSYPHVTFHYVIGNHERMPAFIKAVKALSEQLGEGRLRIWEDYVKIGDGLFIHGDQQLDPKKYHINKSTMYDESYRELNRSFVMQVMHDYGNKIIPKAILSENLNAPWNCALKIMRWLHENNPEMLKSVKHIFNGHTHSEYSGISYGYSPDGEHFDKYVFHNTGASLSRFQKLNKSVFNPLRFTVHMPLERTGTDDPHAFLEGGIIDSRSIERVKASGSTVGVAR